MIKTIIIFLIIPYNFQYIIIIMINSKNISYPKPRVG